MHGRLRRPDQPNFNAQSADNHHQKFSKENWHPNLHLPTKKWKSVENDIFKQIHWTPFTPFPLARSDSRERDFDSPDILFSQSCARLPATERDKSLTSTDVECTSVMHKRKTSQSMVNSRLSDWSSANRVTISTRKSIIWHAELRRNLNQPRRSSTSIS